MPKRSLDFSAIGDAPDELESCPLLDGQVQVPHESSLHPLAVPSVHEAVDLAHG